MGFYKRHARDVGNAVADVNHIAERHGEQVFIGNCTVDLCVVRNVQSTFADAEQKLGFRRVVHCVFCPASGVVFVV